MIRTRMLPILVVAMLLATAGPAAAGADVIVNDTSTGFAPASFVEDLGAVVDWYNGDDEEHTATRTRSPGAWDRALPLGATVVRTFKQVGAFSYFCEIHPEMTGVIRVRIRSSHGLAGIGTPVELRVATASAPTGHRYRIQRRREGGTWATWRTITSKTTTWTPKASQIGQWEFRARTERISNDTKSGWSPVLDIEVSPPN